MPAVLPHGTWPSPVSLEHLTDEVVRLEWPCCTTGSVYWVERRAGGAAIATASLSPGRRPGAPADVVAAEFDARTTVHEYGGRPFAVHGALVIASRGADGRLYAVAGGSRRRALTPPPPAPGALRYGAPVVGPSGRTVYAVRERHAAGGVVNDLVAVDLAGTVPTRVAAAGHDFYNHPVVAPAGDRIAWVCWDHPDMPWDSSELWEAVLGPDGLPIGTTVTRVAGGPGESVTQPSYAPDGQLYFVSDRSGWWNLYRAGADEPLCPMAADVCAPDWVVGLSSYAVLAGGAIVAAWTSGGLWRLGARGPQGGDLVALETPFTTVSAVVPGPGGTSAVVVAGSPTASPCLLRVVPGDGPTASIDVVRKSRDAAVDPAYLSSPEAIEFPTTGGGRAHALYYPPRNPDAVAPPGERPPVIVRCHGGPTMAAASALDYAKQFWTSRGYGVLDVNYRGSTGYGRAYRELLYGHWGELDVDDCVAAARHLVVTGRADPDRLLGQGASAGGFTILCALSFRTGFRAASSRWAVSDLGALVRGAHKFEACYTERLVGPWPQTAARYEARSPARHADRLRAPVIVFQGLDDPVVPPAQSAALVAALRTHRVPHAYVTYPGEGHGVRQAAHVRRTAEAELYFFGRVLGLDAADELAPVEIAFDGALDR